ncbi:hypothetical protein [Conexibacter woesei]|uniref:Uncharacterized protein n=1 Tax=Conexibacter woesei (strain DSM 14684 / CCUG 47730 / CIP 108061 / JCM 11494 / NBRC 100937 / ID131577) TaxID=469383 RepID=D3F2X9_CONWI|nr:hypothetical protein [Conexibacter woesei]ADB54260.1 hypothetical protein Cwoe_5860 [Conexibacter woesei DSM 14684]
MPDTTPDEFVYTEAIRALGRQHATAAELRNGANLLIATAAITISLLGPVDQAGTLFGWLAVAAFVVVCVMALAVIWPHRGVTAMPEIGPMVMDLTRGSEESGSVTTSGMRRELIMSMASHQHLNAQRLTRVSRAFRTGALVLVVQLLSTVAARVLAS